MHVVKAVLAALLLAGLGPAAYAQSQPTQNQPRAVQLSLDLAGRKLAYTASAGLMDIADETGARLGDMSYRAYSMAPKRGEVRPLIFLWNGGPGSNATPLNYGAFGPLRLQDGALVDNPATLIDIADLVFIDQMEAGFGRIAAGVERRRVLNAEGDARAFAQFIRNWRQQVGDTQPVFIIGESYGVYRATLVLDELAKAGPTIEGAVLVSGYGAAGAELPPITQGAYRLPGYAALAYARGLLTPEAGANVAEVHDRALAWAKALEMPDPAASKEQRWQAFATGMGLYLGQAAESRTRSAVPGAGSVEGRLREIHRFRTREAGLKGGDTYDLRHGKPTPEDNFISPAVMKDMRETMGFSPQRVFRGQERDGAMPSPDTPAQPIAYFRFRWNDPPVTLAEVAVAAPRLDLFILGGMFDDILPCALGEEMARRDLVAVWPRVTSKCYPGGHMMYDDPKVAVELTRDVRDFLARAR